MEWERKSLRVGLWVLTWAVLLRLAGDLLPAAAAWVRTEAGIQTLLYFQTGRYVPIQTVPPAAETAPATVPEETEPLTLTAGDVSLLSITNHCGYEPDLQTLVTKTLSWNLQGDEPTVLILHTHATESYTKAPGENYTESAAYRTEDTSYNLVSIGDRLASVLEEAGVKVIHDRTLHDVPSYNGAYSAARKSIKNWLAQYPSIQLVLDLHRDANGNDASQLDTHAVADGKDTAQLMMVCGTDAGGLFHPDWQENLTLAIQLHATLEKLWPGICRPISFRNERFNQDLSPGAVLVEVGGAGDSHEEALAAAEALGKAILLLGQ